MSYNISEEYLSEDKIVELLSLAKLHNDEVGGFPDKEFSIDSSNYVMLQELGYAKAFVARDIDTYQAVGYIVYMVTPHPQFVDVVMAKEDALFVNKDNRGSMLGVKLIKYADKVLEEKYEVDVLFQTATEKFDHSPILKRLGYSKEETTYIRRLK